MTTRAGGAARWRGRGIGAVAIAWLAAGCEFAGGGPPGWDDPGDSAAWFTDDAVPRLGLELADDAIVALRAAPRSYVAATLVFDGRRYGPVGVRLKGQGSFAPIDAKPSFRIDVNHFVPDATFFGLKDLTLDNMAGDPSQLHERLAYWVARQAGLAASRANHVVVTVNGAPYGVYANVETVKPRMLAGHFADNHGALFEATDVDFRPADVARYELEGGPDDRGLLRDLAAALALPDATAAIAAAEGAIDVAHFQAYWAMAAVVGQFDAFPYSMPGDDYFVYADPTTRRLWLLPWGMDETFFAADVSPLRVESVLARQCLAAPACFQGFVDRVWALQALTETLDLDGERARVQALVAADLAADPRRPFTSDELRDGQAQLGFFIRGRRQILGGFLPPPSP